jgi:hypothetical protein
MLGGDIIVLHALGVVFGGSQDFRRLARYADFQVTTLDLGLLSSSLLSS